MKTLSIISIILSVLLIGTSVIMVPPGGMDNCSDCLNRLVIHLFLGLYFLSFSIVAIVFSFKKKTI